METMISFGDWVRRRRKALDLTQQELAHRAGCSLAALQKIERDERRPSRQLAGLLAGQLQVPADQRDQFILVARGERMTETLAPIPQPVVSPAERQPTPAHPELPSSPTPLIGREAELAEITHLLQDPPCRLLTLTGPGGIGKTRLALEAARHLQEAFADKAFFVSLAGVSAPEFIVPAIAEAVGFASSGPVEPKVQLLNYLRQKQALLVLDNLEHLLEGIELLSEILQQTLDVKLLATSREPLHLQAEWTFEVQGLPMPQGDHIEELQASSAAQLFLHRARQARVDFTLTANDRPSVLCICRLVQGLPLALELAAAWVRTLSCLEIAQEIGRSLEFLSASARDLPERHRSMTAVFDHSWKLLSAEEQRVMQQLSAFRGGFTREAAEAVAGASLPLLSALVDKSLVRRSTAERYDLHELIRQYAAARLARDSAEERATRDRHSHYYLALLQARGSVLRSRRQKDVLAELTADIDNLRAAWDVAITHQQVDVMRPVVFPLCDFYYVRDYLREGETAFARGVTMVQSLLAQGKPGEAVPERASLEGLLGELLSYQAQFIFRQGRSAEAALLYQTSLALLRPLADPSALAHTLTFRGVVGWMMGEFEVAWACLSESLSISDALGNEVEQARSLASMGVLAHTQGDYARAYRLLGDGLGRARSPGDPRLIAFIAGHLASSAQALGRMNEVQDVLREGLRLATEIGDRLGIGLALEQMAVAAQTGGDAAEARRLFGESIDQFRDIGDTLFLSHALSSQGYFALGVDDDVQAQVSFKQACQVAVAARAHPNLLGALAGLAILYAREDRAEAALELVTHILQHPSSPREAKGRAEKLRAELEAQLTPQQIETALARAQANTLETLVQEILASPITPRAPSVPA